MPELSIANFGNHDWLSSLISFFFFLTFPLWYISGTFFLSWTLNFANRKRKISSTHIYMYIFLMVNRFMSDNCRCITCLGSLLVTWRQHYARLCCICRYNWQISPVMPRMTGSSASWKAVLCPRFVIRRIGWRITGTRTTSVTRAESTCSEQRESRNHQSTFVADFQFSSASADCLESKRDVCFVVTVCSTCDFLGPLLGRCSCSHLSKPDNQKDGAVNTETNVKCGSG